MQQYRNRPNINQTIGYGSQQTKKKLIVIAYDLFRFIINFISSMVRMILGK